MNLNSLYELIYLLYTFHYVQAMIQVIYARGHLLTASTLPFPLTPTQWGHLSWTNGG